MSLQETQNLLVSALSPDCDAATRQAAAERIRACQPLSTEERLAIYRHHVSQAHIDALAGLFPVCRAIIGERGFAHLARSYCWRTASPEADLNHYGETFPAFLAATTRTLASFRDLPYIEDLARLEWHYHAAWYRPDDAAFDFQSFDAASRQAERIVFCPSASLALVASRFPIREIWHRHRDGGDTASVNAPDGSEHLCIHRAGFQVAIHRIDAAVYRLLSACLRHRTLADLSTDPATRQALNRLPGLIARGWITGFRRLGQAQQDGQARV